MSQHSIFFSLFTYSDISIYYNLFNTTAIFKTCLQFKLSYKWWRGYITQKPDPDSPGSLLCCHIMELHFEYKTWFWALLYFFFFNGRLFPTFNFSPPVECGCAHLRQRNSEVNSSAHAEFVGKKQNPHLHIRLLGGQDTRVLFARPHRERSKVRLKHARCQLSASVTGCRGSAVIFSFYKQPPCPKRCG